MDDLNKTQLQFVSPDVQVQDDVNSVEVSGLCTREHEGEAISWSLLADNGQAPLMNGLALCHAGQFDVTLEAVEQMVCGVNHEIVVQASWGGSSTAQVSRRCQPLVSRETPSPADSPYGTTCALEYTPDAEAQSSCMQVCYRAAKVVYAEAQPADQCSTLAAGLAGP